jgi:hypothetical protein
MAILIEEWELRFLLSWICPADREVDRKYTFELLRPTQSKKLSKYVKIYYKLNRHHNWTVTSYCKGSYSDEKAHQTLMEKARDRFVATVPAEKYRWMGEGYKRKSREQKKDTPPGAGATEGSSSGESDSEAVKNSLKSVNISKKKIYINSKRKYQLSQSISSKRSSVQVNSKLNAKRNSPASPSSAAKTRSKSTRSKRNSPPSSPSSASSQQFAIISDNKQPKVSAAVNADSGDSGDAGDVTIFVRIKNLLGGGK